LLKQLPRPFTTLHQRYKIYSALKTKQQVATRKLNKAGCSSNKAKRRETREK